MIFRRIFQFPQRTKVDRIGIAGIGIYTVFQEKLYRFKIVVIYGFIETCCRSVFIGAICHIGFLVGQPSCYRRSVIRFRIGFCDFPALPLDSL